MDARLRARIRTPFTFGRIAFAASAAFLFGIGCSAAPLDPASESAASTASAETGTLPPRTMTCTMADVAQQGDPSSASFKCTGPWQHEDYGTFPCYKSVTDANICGTVGQSCMLYTTCQNVAFGLVRTINPPMGGSRMNARWVPPHRECDPNWEPSPGHTTKPCWNVPGYYDYDGTCSDYAASNLASGLASVGLNTSQAASWYGTRAIHSYDSVSGASMMCNYGVQNYPVFNARAAAPCAQYQSTCQVPATCRPNTNGTPEPDPSVCSGMAAPKFSDTLQTRNDVLTKDVASSIQDSKEPSKCMTCDGLSATTPDQIKAKHDCLASSLSTLHDNATHLATVQRLQQDLRLLVELQGANLTAAQQAISLAAFNDSKATPDTCNTAWTHPDGVTCSGAERTEIENAFNMCAQLTMSEILPDARSQFVEFCTDAVKGMNGLYDCEGYVDVYTAIMTKLENVLQQYAVTPRDQALLQKVRAVLGN